MEEKQLVPKRRFRGFEGEWKKKNFDEEIELYSGLTYSPNDVQQNGTFVLRSSNVQNGEIVSADDVYVDSEVVNSSNVREGDIIVVVRNGSRSLIGKHAKIKKSMDKTVIGAFMTGVRSNQPNFINALLDTQNFKREIDKNLGATINQITNGMFKSMSFIIPNVKEQQKIGQFFKVLDERIANQKRKIAKVKALKSAYLTEMFPQEGETLPKRRFKGFKGDWKTFKLKDLGMFTSNGVNKKVNKNEMLVNLLNYMDVYKRKKITNENRHTLMQVTANLDQIKKNSVEKNDVFFTPSSETPDDIGRVMVIEESLDNTVYSYHLMRFRPYRNILHSIFPNYVFDTFYFRKQLEFAAQGVQRYVLNRDAFEELLVQLPRINEQKAISDFFRTLDDQIEMEEKKLDKLQKMKEAYLEEMFV